MTKLDVVGIGVWSPLFSNWDDFSEGIKNGHWQSETPLQPGLISPRERRRAPLSVKLAVEVMSQACAMANIEPAAAATVFSSAMGDMQITDYLCRTLSVPPRLVSPTKFHNSVHNATTGYWSIAGQCHAATNAVSAFTYTAPMAFLEAAIQSYEDAAPVLLVTQEMAAPTTLFDACPSTQPFSAALLLTPVGFSKNALATICFDVGSASVPWPDLPVDLQQNLASNFGAKLVPLLAAMTGGAELKHTSLELNFPLSSNTNLSVSVTKTQ